MKLVTGLSNIEVKRFIRKKGELTSNKGGSIQGEKSSEPSSSTTGKWQTLQFGSIQFQRPSADQKPWEQKKFGWMPHPANQRAKFMNDCLPKCYKSFYGVKCNNPRHFVRLFHDEGRRQYNIQEHVSRLRHVLTQY